MNTASIKFNEIDLTRGVDEIAVDIHGISLRTVRGPIGRPDILVKSWAEYQRYYGGLTVAFDDPLIAKIALDGGSQLRINRVLHYTTLSTGTTSAVTATQVGTIANDETVPQELFKIAPIGPGAAYNFLKGSVEAPSNGNTAGGFFNLRIWLDNEPGTTELYENMKISTTQTTAATQDWAKAVALSSFIAKVTYVDLTGVTNRTPEPELVTFTGGTDGGAIVDADYVGDSASKTGNYSFDQIDDILALTAPNVSTSAVITSVIGYATNRKDIVGFAHLDNSLLTENALVAAKDAMNVDSSYGAFFAGGVRVIDPLTSAEKSISEMGCILGLSAVSANENGPWYSFAGLKRGIIQNILGPVNNFGAVGNYNGLNLLANHQINVVINRSKRNYLSGNFTAQIADSVLSFLNVRRCIIHIKKSIGPLVEQYLEDPNTIDTWKLMYMAVRPFFDNLQERQGIYSWDWQGDQWAKNMSSLVINNSTDVSNGKYRVRLFIAPTPSMQQVTIDIIITASGISFEEAIAA